MVEPAACSLLLLSNRLDLHPLLAFALGRGEIISSPARAKSAPSSIPVFNCQSIKCWLASQSKCICWDDEVIPTASTSAHGSLAFSLPGEGAMEGSLGELGGGLGWLVLQGPKGLTHLVVGWWRKLASLGGLCLVVPSGLHGKWH